MTAKRRQLSLHHIERLSSAPEVLRFARQINATFLRQGLTEMKELDSESEAVYLLDVGEDKIVSIVCFYKIDGSEYYIPIVWTSHKYRGTGAFGRLISWLVVYVKSKHGRRISTDVHSDNVRMVRLLERHWEKSFVRFNLPLRGT
jgi:RimJ/RimL family protein N-acetyltransferase